MRSLLPILALLLLAVPVPRAAAQEKFPDLHNLGPLGGKASPVTAGLPAEAKSGLQVQQVYKQGPAQDAGLKVGDVIYGAGDKLFGADTYLELADAILAAEAEAAHTCKLKVKRAGETLELPVSLVHYADETARRKAIRDGALAWLAKQQDGKEGGFYSTMSPEVSQVVLTSLAGLCWLASGEKFGEGKYDDEILLAAAFVEDKVGEQKQYKKLNGKNNNQTNWSLGYGGIFLAHVVKLGEEGGVAKSKLSKFKKKLGWIRDRIFKQAEPDGGFAHGPGGENILGYVHLEILSNFCLAALGCIQAAGVEVDAGKLAPLLKYVESCQMPDGGIGYAHDKLWFSEQGRTAGAMNAFASLGQAGRECYPKMKGYFEKHLANAFDGHSTPTMHQLATAIACKRHGMMEQYWQAQRREYTMVRNPDFSFAYRPTADTARLGMNIDRDIGLVWTTCQWLLIQELENGAAPLWVGTLEQTPDDG
ncbi:MAG: PDZ domain-containing protein [Planctomycetes bacterium]|nr:PDZ domain-containing protein [Planctomycetota bacterium]